LESVSSCRAEGWGIHKRATGREAGRAWMGRDRERKELGMGRVSGRKCGGESGSW